MKFNILFIVTAVFVASICFATDPIKRACLKAANENFVECKAVCSNTKKDEKLECGANPDCHSECRSTYESCVKPFEDALLLCVDSCTAELSAGREICKAQVACTGDCYKNPDFLACLRPYRVTKFNCAQDCRDTQKTDHSVQAALKACSTASKTCHKACKKPATGTPADVLIQ